jgi:NADH-ubiquinone oxidoreductase chain 1
MESELVSGFMTEHSSVVFVFFFLAEYASILLICILNATLFMGGYLHSYYIPLSSIYESIFSNTSDTYGDNVYDVTNSYSIFHASFNGLLDSATLGIKTSILVFTFIWIRASFPRVRYDQLMNFCWTTFLPIIVSLILIVPCLNTAFDIVYINI